MFIFLTKKFIIFKMNINNQLKSPVKPVRLKDVLISDETKKEKINTDFKNSSNTKNLFLSLYKRNEENSINMR